jgi:hypothetical protein
MGYPIDFNGAIKITPGLCHVAGNVGGAADRVSLENYYGCAALVQIYQGAVNTTAITVHKATAASAGTEDTTVTIPRIWKLEDVTAGTTADTWTTVTAAASVTSSSTGSGTSFYLLDFHSDELPEDGYDYKFLEVNLATSSASNYLWVTYFLYGPRYGQSALPTAQS